MAVRFYGMRCQFGFQSGPLPLPLPRRRRHYLLGEGTYAIEPVGAGERECWNHGSVNTDFHELRRWFSLSERPGSVGRL